MGLWCKSLQVDRVTAFAGGVEEGHDCPAEFAHQILALRGARIDRFGGDALKRGGLGRWASESEIQVQPGVLPWPCSLEGRGFGENELLMDRCVAKEPAIQAGGTGAIDCVSG